MLPNVISQLPLLVVVALATISKCHQSSSSHETIKPCTAAAVFLRTPPMLVSAVGEQENELLQLNSIGSSSTPLLESTYTIHVQYPCDSSPLDKIEKLKKSVSDPYISFYLKKKRRVRRDLYDNLEGSGAGGGGMRNRVGGPSDEYDDDDDDDDDEDDDDEDNDEDEEDDDELMRGVLRGMDSSHLNHGYLEPSNHVIPLLPTPSFDLPVASSSTNEVSTMSGNRIDEDDDASSNNTPVVLIEPTPSSYFSNNHHHHTGDVLTSNNEDNELVFAVGSGDGPLVLSTPVYTPSTPEQDSSTTYSSSSTFGNSYYVSSSSSSSPTPTLSSHLLHPIKKQLIYSGVPHSYIIPENTFQPKCSHYDLVTPEPFVDVQGTLLKFFPTTTHISDYTIQLLCQPYSVLAEVYVSVRQRQKSRLHNHAFQLQFGMIRGNLSRVEVMNRVVSDIEKAVGVGNHSNELVVLSTEMDTYPFRITYVNESIITNVCPVNELKRIYEALQTIDGGFIHLEKVTFSVPPDNNQCDNKVVAEVTGEKSGSTSSSSSSSSSSSNVIPIGGGSDNYPPSIKNQIDRLNGTVGEYLVYHVKEDFCYDPEDGGTRNLNIELRNSEIGEVGEDYWLQFDSKNQEFYGLPMGVEEKAFVLVCSDSGGKSANDVLELSIHPPRTPPTSYNTEFNLHFKSIPFTPKAIRKFIEKLSSILSPDIQINSYVYSNNHVLFKWFNTTNPSTENEVTEIRNVMLSDDGPVNKKLYEHFTPEFNVTVASVIPLRKLLSDNNPVDGGGGLVTGIMDGDKDSSGVGGDKRYFDFDNTEDISNNVNNRGGGGGFIEGDELDTSGFGVAGSVYLTTYIIPSVLIAAMILLALIIACLLSRKNKYTQASTDDEDENGVNARVYLKNAKKGVPVIFQDELEEKINNGGSGGGGTGRRDGNIYEPPSSQQQQQPATPRYQNPNNQQQQQQNLPPQPPTRVISPQPLQRSHNNHHHNNNNNNQQPQPPDYQNSISRSMLRNNSRGSGNMMIPHGGVGVYPSTHSSNSSSHHHHNPHHHGGYHSGSGTPPPIMHPPNLRSTAYSNIDSYAPPPGINYYGIRNSNSGGSGFSSGGGPGGGGVSISNSGGNIGGSSVLHSSNSSNKMAPPPYVPP